MFKILNNIITVALLLSSFSLADGDINQKNSKEMLIKPNSQLPAPMQLPTLNKQKISVEDQNNTDVKSNTNHINNNTDQDTNIQEEFFQNKPTTIAQNTNTGNTEPQKTVKNTRKPTDKQNADQSKKSDQQANVGQTQKLPESSAKDKNNNLPSVVKIDTQRKSEDKTDKSKSVKSDKYTSGQDLAEVVPAQIFDNNHSDNKDFVKPLSQADYENLFFMNIKKEDIAVLNSLLDIIGSTEIKNDAGETPLIYAIKQNKITSVRFLLSKKANVYAKDNLGNTPVILAQQTNNKEMWDAVSPFIKQDIIG